jgi:hypothetical protein
MNAIVLKQKIKKVKVDEIKKTKALPIEEIPEFGPEVCTCIDYASVNQKITIEDIKRASDEITKNGFHPGGYIK